MIWTDVIPFSQHPSAYSKVAESIYDRLRGKHQFAHTAIGNLGIFRWEDMLVYPIRAVESLSDDVIAINANHFNADLVLFLKDLFPLNINATKLPIEYLFYVPVDHSPLSPAVGSKLATAFKVVAMSYFGEDELKKKGIKVDATIPHGYDPAIYYPREGVQKEKARSFMRLPADAFIVGLIGRNQIRKMIPRALQVFKRVLERSEDKKIFLMLWTNVRRDIPLIPIMENLDLLGNVYWPQEQLYSTGIPEKDMWYFYNAVDCVICCSGEGFHLPSLEAQACGIPIVVADYAAAPELVGSGYTAKVNDWSWNNEVGVKQPLVDLDDMADKILQVKNGDRETFKKQAVEFVKPYAWDDVVSKQWVPLLSDIEEELRPMVTREGIKPWDQEVS